MATKPLDIGAAGLFLLLLSAGAMADARSDCESLSEKDFSGILDAPTQITSTKYVPESEELPGHCLAEGYVAPNTGIQVYLPAGNWNGKFLKRGCGGFCGNYRFNPWMPLCQTTLSRGYACAVDDMGHKSTPLDAKWAYGNWQAKLDYLLRSTYLTTVASKAIVETFYGKAILKSYFLGGSTGGRQGLLLAQRFPEQFDGIMAGAPAGTDVHSRLPILWAVLANLDTEGNSILYPDDVQLLHKSVMESCDGDDGLVDGIITNPMACHFNVSELICESRKHADCLTAEQIEVARKIYQGPVNSNGQNLARGPAFGSELNWIGTYIKDGDKPPVYATYHGDMYRYLSFAIDPGPEWNLHDFDWDRDPPRMHLVASIGAVGNPDLSRFKERGGKLLMWHGWSDQSVLPWGSINYYELVERTMGGRDATEEFFRFFLLPGVNHVYRGAGADSIDYLDYMEAWVEKEAVPDVLIGVHLKSRPPASDMIPAEEAGSHEVKFTRPHYPYPILALYDGKGDPAKASSFTPTNLRE